MGVDIRHLRAFHAVANSLSFRQASEQLNVAQPALSRTIKNLEEILQVKLFERTTRTTELTDSGRIFLKRTLTIVADFDRAIELAKRSQSGIIGQLRIGFNDFAINGSLPEFVRKFRTQYPMIDVDLTDSTTPISVEQVTDKKLELAFVTGYHSRPGLKQKIVRKERLICIVPATHALSSQNKISIADLADEPFVMGRWETWKSYNRLVNSFCSEHGFTPNVIQEAEHIDGVAGLVAASMGVSILAESKWIHALEGIRVLKLTNRPPEIKTEIIWREDRYNKSQAIRNFVDLVV